MLFARREDVIETMDPVTLSIIDNHLVNICREMGISMIRTSYSTILNEGLDFSCVVFDRDGEMMAQAEFCPAMLGAINFTVKWTIEELGLDAFDPGDVIIHNDPYPDGCHMPEHMVLKPVFAVGHSSVLSPTSGPWRTSAGWLPALQWPVTQKPTRAS